MNFKTITNKMDMSYDFYIKDNMHAVERKIFMLINKNKTIIIKLNFNWRHPSFRKFSHISFIN